ncbi:Integrase [Burkholderia sp. GAS332]|nr:Integrase [Burkholderia sp. GAS332]
MPLTDVKIRQAKANDKPIKLTDSNGLYVEVRPTGAKLWRYRYRLAGKENVFAIGEYPEITLQAARAARDEARAIVRKGTHPAHARRVERAQTLEAGLETFKSIAEEWLGKKQKAWSPLHHDQVKTMFEADAYPFIGMLPMRSITARHILKLMERIEERGSPSIAIKLRQYSSALFQYAVITQRADADPASVLRGAVIKPKTEHSRDLSKDEIAALFRAMPFYKSRRTVLAIKLLMMCFTRTTELVQAKWSEIDLDAGEWRIPPEKIKSRRLHVVPLSSQAKAALLELQDIYGDKGYVLPTLHSNTKRGHMSRGSVNMALEYLLPEHPVPITGHDFRATASTYLHEMGWRDEVIEMQLSHKDKNQTRAAYNHAKYLGDRHEMMQAWSDWLEAIEVASVSDTDPRLPVYKRRAMLLNQIA